MIKHYVLISGKFARTDRTGSDACYTRGAAYGRQALWMTEGRGFTHSNIQEYVPRYWTRWRNDSNWSGHRSCPLHLTLPIRGYGSSTCQGPTMGFTQAYLDTHTTTLLSLRLLQSMPNPSGRAEAAVNIPLFSLPSIRQRMPPAVIQCTVAVSVTAAGPMALLV